LRRRPAEHRGRAGPRACAHGRSRAPRGDRRPRSVPRGAHAEAVLRRPFLAHGRPHRRSECGVAMTGTEAAPRLLIVADLDYAGSEERLIEALRALSPVANDPRVAIQLRAKSLDAAALDALAGTVCALLPMPARLVLNGPTAVAVRHEFDGVHWPEAMLPARVPATPAWHSAAVHSL